MGKGTIVEHLGKGKYTLKLDVGKAVRDERVAKLDARIEVLDGEIDELQTQLDEAQAAVDQARFDADAAIDELARLPAQLQTLRGQLDNAFEAWQDALSSGDAEEIAAAKAAMDAIDAQIAELEKQRDTLTNQITQLLSDGMRLAGVRDDLQIRLDLKNAEREQLGRDKTALLNVDVEREVNAWCSDLTTDATGDVATIEIPGEPQAVLIAPAGRAPTPDDGKLMARALMSPEQAFWNAAVLPGWQRWKPDYRKATVVSVNTENDTATVMLDSTVSTADDLLVNPPSDELQLVDVPVEYMNCNAWAFQSGDRVVVQLGGRSWSNPKVVGFVDNPKACSPFEAIWAWKNYDFTFAIPEVKQALWDELWATDPTSMTVEWRADGGSWHTMAFHFAGSRLAMGGILENYKVWAGYKESDIVGYPFLFLKDQVVIWDDDYSPVPVQRALSVEPYFDDPTNHGDALNDDGVFEFRIQYLEKKFSVLAVNDAGFKSGTLGLCSGPLNWIGFGMPLKVYSRV